MSKNTVKDVEPQTETPLLYDIRKPQRVKLKLDKPLKRGGKTTLREFTFYHTVKPLTNARFFEYAQAGEDALAKATRTSVDWLIEPQYRLWRDLVEEREGYQYDGDDWKEKMNALDASAVIRALLYTSVVDQDGNEIAEEEDAELVYDESALTPVIVRGYYNGNLHDLTHYFREESKAEIDEFLSIKEGDNKAANELASEVKISRAERFYRLGKRILQTTEGYADGSEIPAWYLTRATEHFFTQRLAASGKSLPA